MKSFPRIAPKSLIVLGAILVVCGSVLLAVQDNRQTDKNTAAKTPVDLKEYRPDETTSSDTSQPPDTTNTYDGTDLSACTGNAADMCKFAPSIDFYPGGSEGATNPEFKNVGTRKAIMGRITQVNGKVLSLKTTSGRMVTVTFSLDALSDFNTNRSANYDGLKVAIGDMIAIDYVQQNQPDLIIQPNQIVSTKLVLKDKDVKSYKFTGLEKY